MGSIFDDTFGEAGVTSLFTYGADTDNTITYHPPGNGTAVTGIIGLLGAVSVVEVEGVDGTYRKVYRRNITVSTDPSSDWGGIADPQLKGEVEVDGFRWSIEQTEAVGVESQTQNLVGLSLIRKRPVHKSFPGFRKD